LALQNVVEVSEKNARNGAFVPYFFSQHVTKCRGDVFYRRRIYVVYQSFEKIGAETAEKECLKKTTQIMTVVLCYTEDDLNKKRQNVVASMHEK